MSTSSRNIFTPAANGEGLSSGISRGQEMVNAFNAARGEILDNRNRDAFVDLTRAYSDVLAPYVTDAHKLVMEYDLLPETVSSHEQDKALEAAMDKMSYEDAFIFGSIVEMAIMHEAENNWPSVTNAPATPGPSTPAVPFH